MPNFLFDVKLTASFRIDAPDQDTAAKIISEALRCADSNFGAWPDGKPIVSEASIDGEPFCVEIDGNAPPSGKFPTALDYFIAAKNDGWLEHDSDTPEEYCEGWNKKELREAQEHLKPLDLEEYRREFHEYQQR